MTDHISPEDLDAVQADRLDPERRKELFGHLLRGCAVCQATLQALESPPVVADSDYDEAIDSCVAYALRAERRRRDVEDREKALALLALGEGAGALIERGDMPLAGLGVFEALLERSWAVRHDDKAQMVSLAKLAVTVALRLDPGAYGPAFVADCQARAFGDLGNALRSHDEFWEARQNLGKAFKLLDEGTGDPLLRARLYDFHASLLGTQRKFTLALDSLEVVRCLYREIGDTHREGRVLLKTAMYTYYGGHTLEAIRINDEGMLKIDESKDPGVLATALFNQLVFFEAAGLVDKAKRLLFEHRPLISRAGKIVRVKLQWAEARIDCVAGNLEAAARGFRDVAEFFQETGQYFTAALAFLELALVLMRQGRIDEAEDLAKHGAALFLSLEIHLEVLGAVRLLADAVRLRNERLEQLLERTVAFLREWEHNPEARFLPESDGK